MTNARDTVREQRSVGRGGSLVDYKILCADNPPGNFCAPPGKRPTPSSND